MRRIGIDVGGTNTDAVCVERGAVVAAVKTPTTEDVTGGIVAALSKLVTALGGEAGTVGGAVVIGTTHFTNAVIQRRGLEPVAAVRIGLPAGVALAPFTDWPADLAARVRGPVFMVRGGHEVDGRAFVPLDEEALRAAAVRIREEGVRSVAVTAAFSPLVPEHEERAEAILRDVAPDAYVTCSHELGRIGLLGRENAALLNAALRPLADRTLRAFVEAVTSAGVRAPLYIAQNDGTVLGADYAEAFPVYSFSSGPTNSMRGAAHLSGLTDAMVVDVGGTTTDVGHLRTGFPREANTVVEVGGVRTLFRMPDLLSIGIGGGSLVDESAGTVGPESVGYRLKEEARVFGGGRLTATDLAVATGLAEVGDPSRVAAVDGDLVRRALDWCARRIAVAVDRMKVDDAPLPLVAVGGGAFLVPPGLADISEVVHVDHADVANAVGAAIARIGGEVDQVFTGRGRDAAIEEATRLARDRAGAGGADPATLEVVEVEDLPLAYLPGDARRVRVRVVGEAGLP